LVELLSCSTTEREAVEGVIAIVGLDRCAHVEHLTVALLVGEVTLAVGVACDSGRHQTIGQVRGAGDEERLEHTQELVATLCLNVSGNLPHLGCLELIIVELLILVCELVIKLSLGTTNAGLSLVLATLEA